MEKLSISKQKLLTALAYLLATEPVENIKVSELISKADVSRSTFYRVFETKESFFQWVLDHYMEGLSGAAKYSASSPRKFYQHYFGYIYDNAIYFKTFNNSYVWPRFHYELSQIGIDDYQKFIYRQTNDSTLSNVLSHYVVNAHIGVVMAWLGETPIQSPDKIAELVTAMTSSVFASQGLDLADVFPYRN
ncbi:TetR/AcrR family transcriptional regulator [Lacticaseibacillus brantae]|uniref:TetR family transcriptional regulator n=1 Tax=Lacticaseibacillus brantae DSM 23927 TaxID=1423727 RepID=A0A0R2AWT4_9LACO|nr:TetR/AcrR family transcriptional regulator [Lacticaseibacillus brantae]KRM71431.1 TetR family transcriptional regulator [Lacticaseibacillus brantae DSM 23927]